MIQDFIPDSKLDQNFPAQERIRKNEDFKRIFKQGKYCKGNNLTLIRVSGDTRRIGFVIARHIKGSVIRNKLKRRLREVYRKNKTLFHGEYVIIAYPGAEKMDYWQLQEETLRLTKKWPNP